MSTTDDKTLSAACARHDAKAAEELYRRYSPRLLSICLRYCDDRQSAEDTMHDAFVKIIESVRKYRYNGEGSLYSWMARVTINLCFDSARKRRKYTEGLVSDYDASSVPDEDPEADASQVPPDVLRQMVMELPPGYRTVFKLYVVDGLPHSEIARILGIKEKSSSSNLARARMILQKKVQDYLKYGR